MKYDKETMQNRVVKYITDKIDWDNYYNRLSRLKNSKLNEEGNIRVTIDYERYNEYLIINNDKRFIPPYYYKFKNLSFNGFIEFDISQIDKVTVTKIEFYYFKA